MKCNLASTTFVTLFATTLVLGLTAAAQAADARCSFARAGGTYGFSTSGTVLGVGPRVSAGTISLDAAGNVMGKATSSLNGTIFGETFSGTYTINSDCTSTLAIEIHDLSGNLLLTVTEYGVFDDNLREIRGVFTSAKLPDGTPLMIVIGVEGRRLVP